ncbi:MAG: putative ABC transporter permease [Eggerthellaceae bacterium]|nr:putative ABC transporter permease [Eggerthellaceae bacterium]
MEAESSKLDVSQRVSEAFRSLSHPASRDVHMKTTSRDSARQRSLGVGVRACQAYFAFVLLAALAYALATEPGDFSYDFSLLHGFATAALSAVCIWLFQKHAREARTFAIGAAIACVALSISDMFLFGAFDVVTARLGFAAIVALAMQYALAVAVIVCLAASPTAKRVLSVPIDMRPYATKGHSYDVPLKQRVRTWVFWRDLGLFFIVFSFMGHWAEMLFCYNIYLGVFMGDVDFSEVMLWKQWLFPYCAEGVAVVLIVVLLTPVKEWLLRKFGGRVLPAVLVSVVVTAAVCTTIDFTCGMICNQNYEVWDYRAIPFNFMGQVCLQNSTVYTVAALLILWIFYPLMDRGLRRMPRAVADGLFFAFCGIYAFSALLHFMYVGDVGLIVGDFVMKPE